MTKKSFDEKSTAGASYIINFYTQVQQLNSSYAQYVNLLEQLENKYTKISDIKAMDENDRNALAAGVQSIRYLMHLCHIGVKTIASGIKEDTKNIQKYYENCKNQYIISREHLEKYMILLNSFLVKDIIKNLLESSESLLNDIYGQTD